jgi:DNA-binding CsgD family transcriptional regulator
VDELGALAAHQRRVRGTSEWRRACASLSLATGDAAGALAAFAEARDGYLSLGCPLDAARCTLGAGIAARRAGRRSLARDLLTEARLTFAGHGAHGWLPRVDDELRRIEPRSTSPAGDHQLTATEAQVAELVAAGRTNSEVASELFISAKTVESNLTRIYRKLGVRSRTELAATLRAADT